MKSRSFFDPYNGNADIVEQQMSQSFETVSAVNEKLDTIVALQAELAPLVLMASEYITAGQPVNIFVVGVTSKVRLANPNYTDRGADAFATEDAAPGAMVRVQPTGLNTRIRPFFSGPVWLDPSGAGRYTDTPIDPTNPANAGKLSQCLGKAIFNSGILFNPQFGQVI